ncbi:hypothetical protein IMCC13023_01430 [Candidatus Aquiluna sp. IMCC13023]|nr:hypothetical protein IMCC13023_01430 [Candidatus Aquiluna sp. IMCC13023]
MFAEANNISMPLELDLSGTAIKFMTKDKDDPQRKADSFRAT